MHVFVRIVTALLTNLPIWYETFLFFLLVQHGRSLLMLAAMNNSVEIVQLLLDEGADVNFAEQVCCRTLQLLLYCYVYVCPFLNRFL